MSTQAPPIWQELNVKVCADGSLQQVSGRPVLGASLMPDQYLYFDGQAVNQPGARTYSSFRVDKAIPVDPSHSS